MQAPYSWLLEYVACDESPESMAPKFTMAGLEVGEIMTERFGADASVVAEVTAIDPLESRPDVYVLTMRGGDIERHVLTNLQGFKVGDVLPIAYEGFVFPDGTVLEHKKIWGAMSEGKILAEADVEVSDSHETLLQLPAGAKVGDNVADVLGITEKILKFDLTANCGDCLSVYGIAREMSAILGVPMKKDPFDFQLDCAPLDIEVKVKIKDPDLCGRYSGRILRNIVITDSPVWMKRRLIACGMRPISSIVDVTNYVMLEVGQPLHAFDFDTLLDRTIIVRRAKAGEHIVTIDNADRALSTEMLVIADSKRPVAVAGVMGGLETEITSNTKNMLLESAFFNPRTIRRTARALNLPSGASQRFERGVSPTETVKCSDYASHIIQKLGWGTPMDGFVDVCPRPHKPRKIAVTAKMIHERLGDEIPEDRIESIMKSLHFDVERKKSSFKMTAPGHRFDISTPEDISEEVARIYGYNNLKSELPAMRVRRAVMSDAMARNRRLRQGLVESGLMETMNYSFINAGELEKTMIPLDDSVIRMRNPLTDDHTHLRPSLLPAMLRTISSNLARGNTNLMMFELGKTFRIANGEPTEKDALLIGICGRNWSAPTRSAVTMKLEDYFVLKGIVENFLSGVTTRRIDEKPTDSPYLHPSRCASLWCGDVRIGEIGELHPRVISAWDIRAAVAIADIDVPALHTLMDDKLTFKPISRFPTVYRDLSVIVADSVQAGTIEAIIREHGGDSMVLVAIVDVYRGENVGQGKKSVSFRMEFRRTDRTLNDQEVNECMDSIINALEQKVGGELRRA